MITELKPRFDGRKSFYGKANVIWEGEKKILRSYSTNVCEIENGKVKIYGFYSSTTLRHIKDFLYQNGFEVGSKKQLEKLYC